MVPCVVRRALTHPQPAAEVLKRPESISGTPWHLRTEVLKKGGKTEKRTKNMELRE
jgi:hypothetical protein